MLQLQLPLSSRRNQSLHSSSSSLQPPGPCAEPMSERLRQKRGNLNRLELYKKRPSRGEHHPLVINPVTSSQSQLHPRSITIATSHIMHSFYFLVPLVATVMVLASPGLHRGDPVSDELCQPDEEHAAYSCMKPDYRRAASSTTVSATLVALPARAATPTILKPAGEHHTNATCRRSQESQTRSIVSACHLVVR